MSNFWRATNTGQLSHRDSSDGAQHSVTTVRRDLSDGEADRTKKYIKHDPQSITEGKKPEKKEFLKKKSRKFLACTGHDVQTCRDKENAASLGKKPRKSRDTKNKRSDQTDLQQSAVTPHSRCPSQISQMPLLKESSIQKCIPPELLVSRLTGKLTTEEETASVIRKVFSDGRISMSYKSAGITEEYLNNIVLTAWNNGDWKLQSQNRIIYRMQSLNLWQIDGQIL